MKDIDIGIAEQDRVKIANGLKRLLADSYTLYLQSHNFHWNVSGPQFRELHLMFEEHYTELAAAVDEIAERILTLGAPAPGTYKALSQLSAIEEIEGVPKAEDMVKILLNGHERVVKTCRFPSFGVSQVHSTSCLHTGLVQHRDLHGKGCHPCRRAKRLLYDAKGVRQQFRLQRVLADGGYEQEHRQGCCLCD